MWVSEMCLCIVFFSVWNETFCSRICQIVPHKRALWPTLRQDAASSPEALLKSRVFAEPRLHPWCHMMHACDHRTVMSRCCPFTWVSTLGPASRSLYFQVDKLNPLFEGAARTTPVHRWLLNWFPCKQPLVGWRWSRSQGHVEWRNYQPLKYINSFP